MLPISTMLVVREKVLAKLMKRPEFKGKSPYDGATNKAAEIVDWAMEKVLLDQALLHPYFD